MNNCPGHKARQFSLVIVILSRISKSERGGCVSVFYVAVWQIIIHFFDLLLHLSTLAHAVPCETIVLIEFNSINRVKQWSTTTD
jgi:hypothetical protein